MKSIRIEAFNLMIGISVTTPGNRNETLEEMKDRYAEIQGILDDLRLAKCANANGKSMMRAFAEDLRHCRRGRNTAPSISDSGVLLVLLLALLSIFR